MALIDQYPLKATEDEDGALRRAIARRIATGMYHIPGTPVFSGFVEDEWPEGTIPADPALAVHTEWADGETQATFPAAVILDATGTYGFNSVIDDETPISEGGSYWSPTDGLGAGPAVTLREHGEYEVTYQIAVMTTDKPTRAAIARGIRRLFTPGPCDSRDGIVLDLGDLYWNRRARFRLLTLTRQDTEEAGGTKRRSILLAIRASVPVVEPVEMDLLAHVEFQPPDADSGLVPLT